MLHSRGREIGHSEPRASSLVIRGGLATRVDNEAFDWEIVLGKA